MFLSKKIFRDEPRRARSAYNKTTAAKENDPAKPFYVQTVNERWHAQEEDHRKKEKISWNRSFLLTSAATLAAIFAAVFSYCAYRSAEDTRKSGDRPYVSAEAVDDVFEGAHVDKVTNFIDFFQTWTNSGNTAAHVEIATSAGPTTSFIPIYFTYDFIIGPKSKFKVIIANQKPEQLLLFQGKI